MTQPPRILIVDDTAANIQLAAGILHQQGYDIAFAQSGKEALDQLEHESFDLILLDVMMPVMDGHETIRRLKAAEKTKNIPVIFLTAKSETQDVVAGFELGAVDYVTKPFNAVELAARVKTHLALKQALEDYAALNKSLERRIQEEVSYRMLKETQAEEFKTMATLDSLTRILNRRGIEELLKKEIAHAQNTDRTLSLLLLDLDYFKRINDNYGHLVGDEVLTAAAQAIAATLRAGDSCGRIGGEEFLAIMPAADQSNALKAAERIRTRIESLTFATPGLSITISGGIATLPMDGSDMETLLKLADDALYHSKHNGRNRISVQVK